MTTEPYRVLVAPGLIFSPTPEIAKEKGWMYQRLCFAAVDEPDVEATSHRFVAACNSFWRKKDLKDIEKSVREAVEGVHTDVREFRGMGQDKGWVGR
jgi:hypothetical protein